MNKLAGGALAVVLAGPAQAGVISLSDGIDAEYKLTINYSASMRLKDPSDKLINGPVNSTTNLPTTINFDDGDRNFKAGSLINNRISGLAELVVRGPNYGLAVSGDGFYDQVYHHPNDNDSPGTINKSEPPPQRFADGARYYDGQRLRLLDAYAYGNFRFGPHQDVDLRIGRQVVAWGEALFFSGIATAQAPADASKAFIPGIETKDILLPSNQVSLRMGVTEDLTLLGYYKLEYKHTELSPVGDYFSTTDVVGPGAEFIRAFALAPGVTYNIPSSGEHRPSDFGQWGLGLRYNLGVTELGFYQLRYHDKNPSVFTNYGPVVLAPGAPPMILPTSYDIRYVDGIDLTGLSVSSSIGPVNVAGEVSYKNGVPLLVNTVAGPAAMPGKATQAQASAIYIIGPSFLAREIDLVGEASWLHVNGVEGASTDSLSNSRNAWAYEGTATFNYPNVFNGWDLAVPLSWAHAVSGNAAVSGAFGSLVGHGDQRASVGLTFTYLSRLEVATSYNAFLGSANPATHPLADRDYVALNLKYRF